MDGPFSWEDFAKNNWGEGYENTELSHKLEEGYMRIIASGMEAIFLN